MNDPRVTHYALGELAPAARDAFERDLATSTDLQQELRETITLLEALPHATAMHDTLTDTARETLRRTAGENLHARQQRRVTRRYVAAGALAACLAIGVTVWIATRSSRTVIFDKPKAQFLAQAPTAAAPADKIEPPRLAKEASEPAPVDLMSAPAIATKSGQVAKIEARREIPVDEKLDGIVMGSPIAAADASAATVAQAPSQADAPVPAAIPAGTALGYAGIALTAGLRRDAEVRFRFKQTDKDFNTEAYDAIQANTFLPARGNPLSTFSIDVDTASYANVRRFLTAGRRPPAGAVRLEELINYFPYAYPQPDGAAPFSVTADVTHAPWNNARLLARIALKGRDLATDKLPPSNLVFLIDVSGSMDEPDKLPLLKRALGGLVEKLSPRDRVAIVVYAGASGLALPSTSGEDKARILDAIDRLEPGGSTNGASGIRLAYETAREHFLKEGNNRVILCTDGDFNVGVTSRGDLVALIERERQSGVFLSVLGFGTGNVKDSQMEQLADKGNGNYAYIDTPAEARKVLVEQMGATLFTIAKDVKIQVEFNPATVAGYRLIGYENRLLAKEDFNDDKKDAGEIGAGHTVTALYEIIPAGQALPNAPSVDPLKYQAAAAGSPKSSTDLFTVKLRYKAPDGDKSRLLEKTVPADAVAKFDDAPEDFRFASAVAAFGMKLRADENDAAMDWAAIQRIARRSLGDDPGAYRAEFLTLVQKASQIEPAERSKPAE